VQRSATDFFWATDRRTAGVSGIPLWERTGSRFLLVHVSKKWEFDQSHQGKTAETAQIGQEMQFSKKFLIWDDFFLKNYYKRKFSLLV
jgi:hypothetical protein